MLFIFFKIFNGIICYTFYDPEYKIIKIKLSLKIMINNINIQVRWRDVFNNIHDFYLSAGCNATIKIVFIKKSMSIN